MNALLIVLLIAITGALNIVCFFVGAKVGQKVVKGETIEAPKIPKPTDIVREHINRKEARKEQERIDTIMQNIESYDGTSIGQIDVPKG